MRFRLFGPLGAQSESGPVDLGPPKQRMVVAILLLHANEVVSTERIVDQVWGDTPPKTAEHSVQIYVSELRKAFTRAFGSELIETRPPGYLLIAPASDVDVRLFEQLARDGIGAVRAGDRDAGVPKLEEALDLWTGPPLQEFEYHEFARHQIHALSETRGDAIETLAACCLESGDLAGARSYCRRLVDEEPFREEPRRLMMLALYRSGRQTEALREYGAFSRLLSDEIGIEPSEEIKRLEERILLHDPELLDPTPQTADGANPYRGLRAFGEEDAGVYFGREDVVEDVLTRLEAGDGLVSLVGPSGSGKSSVLHAGVIPGLRASNRDVASFQPGARPLWELAGALNRLGLGTRGALHRHLEADSGFLASLIGRPVVLIADQFEELYTLADDEVANRFAESLSSALVDPECGLSVVVSLRADYFDRPLSMPSLAPLFAASTVTVGPMTALNLERAIVEPAKTVGRDVEPGLLAQLVADMRDQPGALPLLQFTLFDLCERSTGDLTLATYSELGGLQGSLSTAADDILGSLRLRERELTEQLFMRLVKRSRFASTSNPARLRSILELGDRLDLRRVLEAFGERRLITFSRDAEDAATVEIAHEYLIRAWPQLDAWIEEHAADLERLTALRSAVDEWEANERSEDFLFRGNRLERALQWRDATSLRLTSAETAFLDRSMEVRDRPPPPPDVVVWFDRRGDGSFGDLIGAGIDLAEASFEIDILEHTGQLSRIGTVEEAISRGTPLVLLDSLEAANPLILDLALARPSTLFVLMGAAPVEEELLGLPNVRRMVAASEQMGFLAGAVAGLATGQGLVGFIGAIDYPMIREFQAGYEQGARRANPECGVESVYLTGGREMMDTSGFNSVALGEAAASYLHRKGVDVMFHAAGGSGWGMFRWAAKLLRNEGKRVWTIGVDIDQARQLDVVREEWGLDPDDLSAMRHLMLTSVIWRLDLEIRDVIGLFRATGSVEDLRADVRGGRIGLEPTPRIDDAGREKLAAIIDELRIGRMALSRSPSGETRRLLEVLGA